MKVHWKQLKRPRDWPPSEELVLVTIESGNKDREVTAAYWTEQLGNWSFIQRQPRDIAIA